MRLDLEARRIEVELGGFQIPGCYMAAASMSKLYFQIIVRNGVEYS